MQDAIDSYIQNTNIEALPNSQQQQSQQPWPASVDPSLASAALDGQAQQNVNSFNAPNAYMGGNVPL